MVIQKYLNYYNTFTKYFIRVIILLSNWWTSQFISKSKQKETCMSLLRIVISPPKKTTKSIGCKELIELQKKKGLKPADVGKLMAEKLGTNPKTESALYNFFRRGERAISASRIPVLAEIFDVDKEVLFQINTLRWKTLELDCDPKLQFRDFLQDVPNNITTLDGLLVWLSTESQRRILMSKI